MSVTRELIERQGAAHQRREYHRRQFEKALDNLKALAAQTQGGCDPRLEASGERLRHCDLADLEAAVIAFADAIRDSARESATEGEALLSLANASIVELRSLAHHVDRQVAAQRDAEVMASLLHQTDSEAAL